MKFLLKRRLNPFLLLTTVVGLSLLVGLSIVFQTQFEDIAGDRAYLQTEIEQLNSEIESLEQNNTQLSEQNHQLRKRTSELENQISEIESQESGLEDEVSRLENQTSQLQKERNNLREERDDVISDLDVICQLETIEEPSSKNLCDKWAEGWDSEN